MWEASGCIDLKLSLGEAYLVDLDLIIGIFIDIAKVIRREITLEVSHMNPEMSALNDYDFDK